MSDPEIRVGTTERQAAQQLLQEHFDAGRLDPNEYEDRRGRAGDAITRADLDALFTDLPTDPSQTRPPVRAASDGVTTTNGKDKGTPPKSPAAARRGAFTGMVAIAATALFFTTGQWTWFLLIPLVALLWTFVTGRDD